MPTWPERRSSVWSGGAWACDFTVENLSPRMQQVMTKVHSPGKEVMMPTNKWRLIELSMNLFLHWRL